MAVFQRILVILGATASGKSALAMEVARRVTSETAAADSAAAGTALNRAVEILSADSMQVYRGMDIGTAKPTTAERALVRHHLLDVVEPDQTFTVARFVEMADAIIADAAARQTPLIVTGGTPLYYKSLFEGLFDGPGANPAIRERLGSLSSEELARQLAEIDPAAAARIHVNDRKRLVRALEVYELTGRPISSFQTHWTAPTHRHPAVWVGLRWEPEPLNRRINARVKAMLAEGWVDETRRLLARYAALSKTAAEATGYRELIEHVQGRMRLDEAAELIKIATRQLARRQMKWFKRFPNVHWLDGAADVVENARRVMELWQQQPISTQ